MTTITAVPVDEITARAREVRFSRVALTLFLGVFWVIGWMAGKAWLGTVMCCIATRRGFRDVVGDPPLPARPARPGA